jgi:hypothetical protein
MPVPTTTLAAIERQPHLPFSHWEAQDYLPSFEFSVSPKIDYFQVFLFDTDLGNEADTLAALALTGTRSRAKPLRKATAGAKGVLVTVHDPSPAVIRRLDDALRSLGLREQSVLSELEVSLDFRPADGDPLKLGELNQWVRYFVLPGENIQKRYRCAGARGRRKTLPVSPLDYDIAESLVPHRDTFYMGHSEGKYVDPSLPHGGYLRSYIKIDEQTGSRRTPLPEDQWSARLEANVQMSKLEQLGLRRPGDLLGCKYRKFLSGYFRFCLPEIRRRPRHRAPSPLAMLVDRQLAKFEQHLLAIGVRATTDCRYIRQRRHKKANARITDTLGNLQRKYGRS